MYLEAHHPMAVILLSIVLNTAVVIGCCEGVAVGCRLIRIEAVCQWARQSIGRRLRVVVLAMNARCWTLPSRRVAGGNRNALHLRQLQHQEL